jgi:hypothetical protein
VNDRKKCVLCIEAALGYPNESSFFEKINRWFNRRLSVSCVVWNFEGFFYEAEIIGNPA